MSSLGRRHAIYNPGLLHRDELIASFVARTAMLRYLVEDIRQGGRQHHMIVGQRGAGKTTLLLRLACAVEDDPELAKRAIALRFPEEQYNVASLSDFWLNCLDALVDALEQRGDKAGARKLDAKIASIDPLPEEDRAREGLQGLLAWAKRANQLVVLLVDNVDLILDRLAKEHWDLRETLSQEQRLMLIGASSKFLEEASDYKAAFYEFFNLHELAPLGEEEAKKVVQRLAEQQQTPEVSELLEKEPGRFKALLALSGGTPRTLVLLHGILARGAAGHAEDDLEALLDQLTPYYKARFDDLSPQNQQIVDAVALHWHPITAQECEAKVRLGGNATSSLLHRLCKQGVLSSAAGSDARKLTFQISERFFNIWYLMRASRRLRRRLLWLVGFLQSFYGEAEVEARAKRLLAENDGAAKDPARLLAFASAVKDVAVRHRLEFLAVEMIFQRTTGQPELPELLDLEGEDRHLAPVVERVRVLRSNTAAAHASRAGEPGDPSAVYQIIARNPLLPIARKHELMKRTSFEPEELTALQRHDRANRALFGEELLSSIATGELPGFHDPVRDHELYALFNGAKTPLQQTMVLAALAVGKKWLHITERDLEHLANNPRMTSLALFGIASRCATAEWPIVEPVLRRILEACVTDAHDPALLPKVWKVFVGRGLGAQAAQLLQDAGKHELALPLYEALRAAGRGQRESLGHLAPELRAPAEQILKEMLAPPDEEAILAGSELGAVLRQLTPDAGAPRAKRPSGVKPKRARPPKP